MLKIDGEFGRLTTIAVRDHQLCRGIRPANSIVDRRTADVLLQDTETDSCPTSLTDLGPPRPASSPGAGSTANASPTPSPSPTATDTLLSPSPT